MNISDTLEDGLKIPFKGQFRSIQYSSIAVIKKQNSVSKVKLDPTGFTVKAEVTLNSQDYVKAISFKNIQ